MNHYRYKLLRNQLKANQICFQFRGRLPSGNNTRNRKTNVLAIKAYGVGIEREVRQSRQQRANFLWNNGRKLGRKDLMSGFKGFCVAKHRLRDHLQMSFKTVEHKKEYCRQWFNAQKQEHIDYLVAFNKR